GRDPDTAQDGLRFHGLLVPRLRRSALRLLVGRMSLERAGERELAELVPDHVLVDEHRYVLLAVVDGNRQADELGQHRRAARPGLDRALVLAGRSGLDLLQEVMV